MRKCTLTGADSRYRLFLQELNINYEDVLYTYDETWPSVNKAKGVSLTGSLPVLEIDGERLYQVRALLIFGEPHTNCVQTPGYTKYRYQHLAILRYLSRRAGAYDGETNHEKYLVDAAADIYNDWRVSSRY